MIHSSAYRPMIMPIDVDTNPDSIDRVQEITSTTTLGRTKIEEVGRDGLVDWSKATPEVSVTLRQMEYGSIEFFRRLACKGDSVSTIEWTDFKTPTFDIAGYETDDNDTFLGTIWYPKLRTAGLTLNIGDPSANIERNFTFAGEDEIMLREDNKYLIHKRFTASGGNDETFTVEDPAPQPDPDKSGQYLFRVVRVRSGTATTLTHGTGWSYDGTDTLTVNGLSVAGDVIKVWYSGSSYINGVANQGFVQNDSDLASIKADAVSIYLESSNYLYRLQSASLDVTLDRFDVKEIGDDETVTYGTRDITTRVVLGRVMEAYTIEEILRGKAGLNYGKIDVRKFSSNFNLIIKIYNDENKGTFKLGYKCTDLAPVSTDKGTPTSDYVTRGMTLEGESGFVTNVVTVL